MYVIAFTSGRATGESLISRHRIQLQYGSIEKTETLYDRPGVDYELNKGDLWSFSLSAYGCVTLSSIRRVSVVEGGIDAWNIESIVTLVREELPGEDRFQVLTQKFGVNLWVNWTLV